MADAVIYGLHPVQEALSAGRSIERILVAQGRGGEDLQKLIEAARARGIPVRFEGRPQLDRLARTEKHQGVVALAAAKDYSDIGALVADAQRRRPALFILDGIEDPRNLGAIIRTADAAGFAGVIVPKRRAAGLSDIVAKASAGAIEHHAVARVANLAQTIEDLKRQGIWTYGLDPSAKKSYLDLDYTGPVALVIGAEGAGLARLVREKCDELISIPMRGKVASLNASVAAGVLAYEVLRQRSGSPGPSR